VWQTFIAVGGLLVATPTAVVAAATFRRTARVADVQTATAAQQVGLDYLRESLATQQATIIRQEGEIGALRGELKGCREERQAMAAEIADLRKAIS
jgi:septal ring factor EnvC (AmiA/AmiB activator)